MDQIVTKAKRLAPVDCWMQSESRDVCIIWIERGGIGISMGFVWKDHKHG